MQAKISKAFLYEVGVDRMDIDTDDLELTKDILKVSF